MIWYILGGIIGIFYFRKRFSLEFWSAVGHGILFIFCIYSCILILGSIIGLIAGDSKSILVFIGSTLFLIIGIKILSSLKKNDPKSKNKQQIIDEIKIYKPETNDLNISLLPAQIQDDNHSQKTEHIITTNPDAININKVGLIFLAMGLITIFIYFLSAGQQKISNEKLNPTENKITTIQTNKVPQIEQPILTPTTILLLYHPELNIKCKYWEDIDKSDENEDICFYGRVFDSYSCGKSLCIIIGNEDKKVRLFVPNIRQNYLGIKGKCILTDGNVQMYNDLPVINVSGKKVYFPDDQRCK